MRIHEVAPDVKILGEARNVKEAADLISEVKPDLVFLDIEMPGGNGLTLFDQITEPDFDTIFVTGHSDYVLGALKVSAVDYLLKPVNKSELVHAIEKVRANVEVKKTLDKYKLIKHNIQNQGDQNSKIAIASSSSYDVVKIADILRCEGAEKYTLIYLNDGSKIISSYHLGVYKEMLVPYGFFSSHRSHLVNTDHITKYLKEGTIILSDRSTVPVSRRKKEEFTRSVLSNFAK